MRRPILRVLVVLALAFAVAACSSPEDGTGGTTSADATAVPPDDSRSEAEASADAGADTGEMQDFVAVHPAMPETLDPQEQGQLQSVTSVDRMSKPLQFDARNLAGNGCDELPSLEDLTGDLAESWEVSEDGKAITVKFKEGVLSPFGNELTSDDVKWSLDRGVAIGNTIGFFLQTFARWDPEETVEIIDDYTVQINVADPGVMDVAIMTLYRYVIHDTTALEEHITEDDPWAEEWLRTNMAEFGPWTATSDDFLPAQEVTFHLNENYHNRAELGNINRLVIQAIPDASTRAQLVETGDADYAAQLTPPDYERLSQGGAQVLNCAAGNRDFLVLNQSGPPFDDVRVRRAISLALDRETLAQAAYHGFGASGSTDGLHAQFDFERPGDDQRYRYDPDAARQLLEEAGYGDGFDFELTISPQLPHPQTEQLAVNIQSMLADVGITVSINVVPSGNELQTAFLDGRYEALIHAVEPAIPDPAYAEGLFSLCGGYMNSYDYCSEEHDNLVEALRVTQPGEERRALMTELSALIVEDVPVVYLTDGALPRAFSNAVDVDRYVHHPYMHTINPHLLTKSE